jgi:hypothetical protein
MVRFITGALASAIVWYWGWPAVNDALTSAAAAVRGNVERYTVAP